jgi:F-type H+-transporting ATPase subunit gamma
MANLKEIRIRIASVISTRQITSAMKMVSAAKLRKAQDAILQIRPYAGKLHDILMSLVDSLAAGEGNEYAQERDPDRILLVVITSNKGLCGAFNSNVIKKTLQMIEEDFSAQSAGGNVHLLVIGKKGYDFFKSRSLPVIDNQSQLYDHLTFENVSPLVEDLMDKFLRKEYDRILLVYNQFKNAAVQLLTVETFLPVKIEVPKDQEVIHPDYIFEPTKEVMVKEIIPKSLKIQFFKALLDSFAAEHGARMTAMYKATDNATELLNTLRLNYNKARQASITNEILEIVSGANALGK